MRDHSFEPLVAVKDVNGSDTCRICHRTLRDHEECAVVGCMADADALVSVTINLVSHGRVEKLTAFCEPHAREYVERIAR